MMHFVAFHIDGREGTGGTEVLAGTAADAALLVDGGHVGRFVVIGIAGHHLDGSCGTVALAVAAVYTVGEHQTVLLNPYGVANLRRCLVFEADGLDGSSRADLRAAVALGTAVAQLITHGGHHQMQQVGRRAQHLIRALRHAELKTRAVLCEVLCRERARRREGSLSRGRHLVFNLGETSVNLLLLLRECRRGKGSRGNQEGTLAVVGFLLLLLAVRPCMVVFQCMMVAHADAVAAHHTARSIDGVVFEVDACGLAVLGTKRAVMAFLFVDVDFQPGESGEER